MCAFMRMGVSVYACVSMCVCACTCLCMCAHRVAVKVCTLPLSWAKPTITVDMLCNNKVLCVAGKRS